MHGLGDNIYQRAFVREIKDDVFLYTSWPQIYKDLENVYPVRPITCLRTQNKNINRQPDSIWSIPKKQPELKIIYGKSDLQSGSILSAMRSRFNVTPKIFDLPKFTEMNNIIKFTKTKYAIIRPVTVRTEWKNEARNPLPEYINKAAEILKKTGYTTVSVADIEENEEYAETLPHCDIKFNNGELNLECLMSIVQNASLIVGSVGWIVPASIAAGIRLIIILGGHGGYNAPEKIVSGIMNTDKISWIYPDNYCRCTKKIHNCNKTVTNFEEKFTYALGLK